ncbi:MAG: hypothetical protein ACL7AX_04485 [Candidatus Arsenophonus phytopathogenicus]
MKQNYPEKIAFCFPSRQIKEDEKGLVELSILLWVVDDDIDYMSHQFSIWISIGFINLVKKSRYIVKINIYKKSTRLSVSPNPDAGIVVEPDNTLSSDERVVACMTEKVSIFEKPENGIYKVDIRLHLYNN